MPPITPPVALDKAYALTLWLLPRAYRFTLGDRLSSQSLDLLAALS